MDRASLTSALSYRDPRGALDWLQAAFGFEIVLLLEDAEGRVAHAEMAFGNSRIMVGSEWSETTKSPASVGGKNTQTVHIHIDTDVDAHCARAAAAGAEIVAEPQDQFYGDRTYRCRDLEGHLWTIGQTLEPYDAAKAEAATGLKTTVMV